MKKKIFTIFCALVATVAASATNQTSGPLITAPTELAGWYVGQYTTGTSVDALKNKVDGYYTSDHLDTTTWISAYQSALEDALYWQQESTDIPYGVVANDGTFYGGTNATSRYVAFFFCDHANLESGAKWKIYVANTKGACTLTSADLYLQGTFGSGLTPTTGGDSDADLLPGKFSVSATKQVQFTKSNLYWDGSAFQFEANQTDHQTSYVANHVSHFYWSSSASVMCAATYSDASAASTDAFFFCEANKDNDANKVGGTSGYYDLTKAEWGYVAQSRTNASNLIKYGVTVTNGSDSYTNCLILAPDDYSGTALSAITDWSLSNINALGLVCLPAAGRNFNGGHGFEGSQGYYWTATPYGSTKAYMLNFDATEITGGMYMTDEIRQGARSIRLVKDAPASPATGLEAVETANENVKLIENGRLVILRNGIKYDAAGRIVK